MRKGRFAERVHDPEMIERGARSKWIVQVLGQGTRGLLRFAPGNNRAPALRAKSASRLTHARLFRPAEFADERGPVFVGGVAHERDRAGIA